jgi:histidinol-phosphate aminotransferase
MPSGKGMPLMARPPRAHGGPVAEELRELGLAAGDLLDFSVNVNPYGPAPAMLDAIRAARVDRYPDPTAREAREALALPCGVPPERIVLGNGGAELLWSLARLLVAPGRTVLMVEPTFSEFRAAALAAHGRVVEWRAVPESAFAVDVDAVVARARATGAAVIYLCTPNNPTGTMVRAGELHRISTALPAVTVVVDQAFLSLSDHHADGAVDLPANVVRVRSLTKEHAIPGVRVGYAIATAGLASAIEAARPAWTTSSAAQAAAIASGRLSSFVADSRDRLLADRRALVTELGVLGLAPLATSTTFCVVPLGDATLLRQTLLRRHHIQVRDCASFGMADHQRLAARPARDRERLCAALSRELRP